MTAARPFYLPSGDEVEVFTAAWRARLPVLVTGPTGCGKTRFVEHMAARLGRPLVTVAGHEDLTAADLIGRFHLRGGETVWQDGPLVSAMRSGALCYLDEIVEARSDTTVVIHPAADHRRTVVIDRLGETLTAPPEFGLVMSYNPGYQSVLKDLKPSTRQRFVTLALDYPEPELETTIVATETSLDTEVAASLVHLGVLVRRLEAADLAEVASTRALISAGKLIRQGMTWSRAVEVAVVATLSDDRELAEALRELARAARPAATDSAER